VSESILSPVERELILRNVVCPASVVPADFGVEAFEEQLALGEAAEKVVLPDLSIVEWEKARIQILPERIQLGFKNGADSDLVRRSVECFLGRLDELTPEAPVGFNSGVRLKVANEERDPSTKVLDSTALAEALGGTSGRGGIALVYHDDTSRWWVELSPRPDEERQWTFDFNRHFNSLPETGKERDGVTAWFSDVEADLVAKFETLSQGVD
jgi:hypothetical protein